MTSSAQSTRNFIPIQNKYDRVVLLVDMDCFYCQVEEKLDPSLVGQPLAVVQYNAWRGGGIIAVNYAARAKGVSRHMRGDEAREQCPDIKLVKVPNVREKADLTKYREAGKEVANVLQRFTPLLERASVDEAYLDITEVVNKRLEEMNSGSFVIQPTELHNTYAVGYENIGEYIGEITARFSDPYCNDEAYQCAYDSNDVPAVRKSDIRLLIGASIASEIRAAVKDVTGYECSAGVAHNKILAKLACGLNKPNKQTILPLSQITGLFDALPVGKIKGLGGKFGEEVCERLKIRFLGQLQRFTEADLQRKFDEKNGSWLYYISRGIDLEAVVPRFYSKSIGCCKKFPGRNNITGLNTLNHWLNELANEICERLEKDIIENNRRAKNMVVSFIQEFDGEEISSSRTGPLQGYDKEILVKSSLEIIKANTSTFLRPGSSSVLNNPIKFLGISVGKFETISNAQNKLQEMFANQAAKTKKPNEEPEEEVVNSQNVIPEKLVGEKKNMLRSFLVSKKAEQGTGSTNSSTDSIPNKKDFAETNPMKSFFLNALKKSSSESQINRCETIVETDSTNQQGESDEQVTSSQSLVPEKVVVEKKNSLRTFLASNKQEQGTDSENISTEKSNPKKSFFLNALRKSNSVDQINRCENNVKTDSINQRIEESKSFFVKALKKQSPVEPNLLQDNNSIDSENDIKELEAEINLIESEFAVPSSSTSDDNETIVENNDNDQTTNETIGGKKRKYSDIDNSTSTHSETNASIDYQSSYAEYAIPELRSDLLQFSICNICNAKIPSDERLMQMHQDHHFAQQLSQQQRIEFRKEISIKIAKSAKTPPSVGKKPKKPSLNNTTLDSKTDITKFLKPSQSNSCENVSLTASTSLQAAAQMPTDMVTCPECKISVKCSEIDEHKDFHIAKNLQRKLNQLEVRTVPVVQKVNGSKLRKNLNTSLFNNTTKSVVTKPITQFFSQPNL